MRLFKNDASYPKVNAQNNLCGRTHYVDDGTLRFHKSRIISARATDQGLLFAIVMSDAVNYENTKRGFRFVVFDVFGTVLARTKLEETFCKSEQATRAMWAAVNAIDAKAVTLLAIERQRKQHSEEMDRLQIEVESVETRAVA